MKKQNNKGITLIALIITIIVMLILVGVSVTIALNGGLFSTAKDAADRYKAERENEEKIATEEYIQGMIDSIGGTENPDGGVTILEGPWELIEENDSITNGTVELNIDTLVTANSEYTFEDLPTYEGDWYIAGVRSGEVLLYSKDAVYMLDEVRYVDSELTGDGTWSCIPQNGEGERGLEAVLEFAKSIDPTYGGIPNSVGVYNYDLYTSCPYPYIYDYIADGGEDGWDEETESSYWVYNGVYLKVFDPDFGEEREYDGEEDPEGVWTFTGPFAIRGSRRVDSLKVAEDGTLFVD